MKRFIFICASFWSLNAYAASFRLVRMTAELPPSRTATMRLPEIDVTIDGEPAVYKPKIAGDVLIIPATTRIESNQVFASLEAMQQYVGLKGCDPATWGTARRHFRASMTKDLNRSVDSGGSGTGEETIDIQLSDLPQAPRLSAVRFEYDNGNTVREIRQFCKI